jgi:MFS superfamily sulfate permease-like transporter
MTAPPSAELRPFSVRWLGDLAAGAAVAGLLLPEAVAYAGIAGLPPQRAILAGIAGTLVYAATGRSRFAIVAPTSSAAAILAAALANLPGDAAAKADLATILVGFVGCFFVLAGLARLGGLTGFISRPVLKGFAFGLAITIIIRQMPLLIGVQVRSSDLWRVLVQLVRKAPDAHLPSLAVGLCALAMLFALKKLPRFPAAFLVLALGIAASALMDLPGRGVAVVGAIDLLPSWPALPHVPTATLSHAAQLTLPLVLILFAESWGTMRSLALRHGDVIEPNRELCALGWSNLASAAVQGLPVGAGFSAGATAEASGASSRIAAAAAGIVLAVLAIAGSGFVAKLPEPVLAAVVIAALSHALDPEPFLRLWRLDRDRTVGVATALGVLAFGVVNGMLLAIGLSIASLVHRLATPNVVQLGRIRDSHDFVDIARHPEARAPDGIAIWRPAEPLFFANAERVLQAVERKVAADRSTRAVVLSLEESFDLDSTALDVLLEFDARIRAMGLPLHLARTRDAIRDLLQAAGADDLVDRCGYSVDDAVSMTERVLPSRQTGATLPHAGSETV